MLHFEFMSDWGEASQASQESTFDAFEPPFNVNPAIFEDEDAVSNMNMNFDVSDDDDDGIDLDVVHCNVEDCGRIYGEEPGITFIITECRHIVCGPCRDRHDEDSLSLMTCAVCREPLGVIGEVTDEGPDAGARAFLEDPLDRVVDAMDSAFEACAGQEDFFEEQMKSYSKLVAKEAEKLSRATVEAAEAEAEWEEKQQQLATLRQEVAILREKAKMKERLEAANRETPRSSYALYSAKSNQSASRDKSKARSVTFADVQYSGGHGHSGSQRQSRHDMTPFGPGPSNEYYGNAASGGMLPPQTPMVVEVNVDLRRPSSQRSATSHHSVTSQRSATSHLSANSSGSAGRKRLSLPRIPMEFRNRNPEPPTPTFREPQTPVTMMPQRGHPYLSSVHNSNGSISQHRLSLPRAPRSTERTYGGRTPSNFGTPAPGSTPRGPIFGQSPSLGQLSFTSRGSFMRQ